MIKEGETVNTIEQRAKRRICFEHETLMDAFWRLQNAYSVGSRGLSEIAGVAPSTIYKWMRDDSYQSPLSKKRTEDRRLGKLRAAWQARKPEIVSRIHTQESDAKRAQTRLKNRGKIEQYDLKLRSDVLGDNWEEELKRLYVDNKMPIIAMVKYVHGKGFSISSSRIKGWLQQAGIEIRGANFYPRVNSGGRTKSHGRFLVEKARKEGIDTVLKPSYRDVLNLRFPQQGGVMSLDEIGKRLGGITREAVRQREKAALNQLASLLVNY